jgi:hypothetical protein
MSDLTVTLDQNEVEKAVLLPIGDGYIHRFKEQNRELEKTVANSDRFMYFCTVNPWFGEDALKELDDCFCTHAASGLAFDTSRQGLYIDSPMIFPFIDIAAGYNKPVYFHTGVPLFALPLNLANLAHHFPGVSFIMGAMGVSDYWGDIIPSFRLCRNLYLETSVNTNVPAVMKNFIAEFGDENIMFGSNFPFTDYVVEWQKIERAGICEKSMERIFVRNACDLLEITL